MNLTLFFLYSALATSMSFAEVPKQDEKWFQCEKDADCVEIKYSCSGGVVNKVHAKEADRYFQYISSVSECIQLEPTEAQKKIPYKVFCEKRKCGSKGVYPKKPGFS